MCVSEANKREKFYPWKIVAAELYFEANCFWQDLDEQIKAR